MNDSSDKSAYSITLTAKWFGRAFTLTGTGTVPVTTADLLAEDCQDVRQVTLYIPTGSTLEISNRSGGTYVPISEKVFSVPCANNPLAQCWVRGSGPVQVFIHGFPVAAQRG